MNLCVCSRPPLCVVMQVYTWNIDLKPPSSVQFFKEYANLLRTQNPSEAVEAALRGYSYHLFHALLLLPPWEGTLFRGLNARVENLDVYIIMRFKLVHS